MFNTPHQKNILGPEPLSRSRNRQNRIFLIVLLTFVVAVFSFSFVHFAKETGRSVPVDAPGQAERQGS